MKNKKITALICGALMTISSMAFATVRADQVVLGDLQPGMKVSELKKIYGEPHRVDGDKWRYTGFYVELNKRQSIVEEIYSEDPGFATSEGVAVGMSEDFLNQFYGKADKLDYEKDGKEYVYYSSNYRYKMEFKVRDGIIKKIKCELRD